MITDLEAARELLEKLGTLPVSWCFLHGESRLLRGDLDSDLDLAVDQDPADIAHRLDVAMQGAIRLVLQWQYDPWSLTTFWARPHGGIVQLDLTFDPLGRNKYGIRTGTMLDHKRIGDSFPTAATGDEHAYLLSKRLRKGQQERAVALVEKVPPGVRARVPELISPPMAAIVIAALDGQLRRVPRFPLTMANALRLAHRVRSPTGVWLSLRGVSGDPQRVSELASEWASLLPHVYVVPPGNAIDLRTILVRRRPSLILSADPAPRRHADAEIDLHSVSPKHDFAACVEAMNRLVRTRGRRK